MTASINEPKIGSTPSPKNAIDFVDGFARRHIGPSENEIAEMLSVLGFDSLESLSDATVPSDIRLDAPLDIPNPRGEREMLQGLKTIASKNKVYRSCIGMGYTGTVTPPVILRNVLENPGWYTQYTVSYTHLTLPTICSV